MAEALAAVGVASSIIALVDFSLTLYSHIKEIIADVNDVPKSFRPINTQLPVLMRTVELVGKASKEGKLDRETAEVVAPTMERFKASIQKLEEILAGVLLDPKDRKSKKLWKRFMGIAKESEVKNTVKDICRHVDTLTLCLVASALSPQPLTDEKLVDIRRWLLASDPTVNYQNALLERQANTCQWFLKGRLYQDWKGAGSSIWLHGIPGCGKTILSTTAVEDIQPYTANDPEKALAYFYFVFKDQQKQKSESLVRSLIHQLSHQFASIPAALEKLHESYRNGEEQPHPEALLGALEPLIRVFPHTFIIIDALDECTQRKDLMKVIQKILMWQIKGLHLLMTSRREEDIEDTLGKTRENHSILSIEPDMVDQDIQLYIRKRLSQDDHLRKWLADATLQQQIESSLLRKPCGMFRWAVCQLDFLRDCRNRRELLQALNTLPPTLDATYDRIFGAIRASDQPYALRILRWLTFATRPLYLLEIAQIAAMDPNRNPIFDREEILEHPSDVLSICSSLIVVTEEAQEQRNDPLEQDSRHVPTVQLAHYSVKEYLVSQRICDGPAAFYGLESKLCNTQIAKCCLQYLLQFEYPDESHKRPLPEFSLKLYSAKNWVFHMQAGCQHDKETENLCFELLSMRKRAFVSWLKLYKRGSVYVQHIHNLKQKDVVPGIYYASHFGLSNVVERMLKNGDDPNAEGGFSLGTPLQAAARNGHLSTVRVLIQRGADVRLVGENGADALSAALSKDQINIVRFLISHGADSNGYCPFFGGTVHAAMKGSINAVQLMLESDCDLYRNTGKDGNALQACAWYGNPEIATALIQHGSQINGTQGRLESALHSSSWRGNLNMVKFLLAHGADIHEQDEKGKTALRKALKWDRLDIVKHIVDHAAATNQESPVFNFDHELCRAIENGDTDTAALFLNHGADPHAIVNFHYGPIRHAVKSDSFEFVKLLIAHGVDANAIIPSLGRSPFMSAIEKGNLDHVKFLIDSGANSDGQGECKGFPLWLASKGPVEIVRLLIDHGADASRYHKGPGSALERASGEGQLETVKLLISKGAPVNHDDFKTSHPLQSAAKYGHLDVARYLLAKGADNNARIAALHAAVSMRNMEMMALLIDHLPHPDISYDYLSEALRCAVWSKPVDLWRIICEKGSINNHWQDTPSDEGCAVWKLTEPTAMVRFLIEKGANVDAQDDQNSTALIQAVRANECDVVKLLLEKGADPNARDKCGTALLATLQTNHLYRRWDTAKSLIDCGADVNEIDDRCGTLLEMASTEGYLDIVELLIKKGADVEHGRGKYGSALIAASCSSQDHPRIVDLLLLQKGFNIEEQHPVYGSALSAASKRGHVKVVERLLKSGAGLNNTVQAHGSALRAAFQGSFEEAQRVKERKSKRKAYDYPSCLAEPQVKVEFASTIELLVQKGAVFSSNHELIDNFLQAAMSDDLDAMKMTMHGSDNLRQLDNEVFNAVLWIASCKAKVDIVRLLFTMGPDGNPRNLQVGQAERYSLALKSALSRRHFDIASFLIEKGANAHIPHLQLQEYLYFASADGYFEVLKFMLGKYESLKPVAELYSGVLVAASAGGYYAIADFLIEKGADLNAPSKGDWTALSAASSQGQYQLVELLIAKGADVNATTEKNGSPLLAASARSHRKIVQLLISKGADVNATHEKHGCALHAAISREDHELIDLLLGYGADVNAHGGNFGNALHLALTKGYCQIARRLIQKEADINAQGGRFGDVLQATLSVDDGWAEDGPKRRNMALFLIEIGADIHTQGGQYGNPLLAALSNSHYYVAEVLIRKGADINSRAGIIDKARLAKLIDEYQCFEEYPNLMIDRLDMGNNAAISALMGGYPDKARELVLHHEKSFVASASEYCAVLFAAIIRGNIALATLLLDRAEDSVLSDNVVNDLLLTAITCRKDVVAKALIDRGANVNAQDGDGHSALQVAVLTQNFFMMKILIEKSADINASSTEHGTVLQTVITILTGSSGVNDHIDLIDYLIERGADLNVQGGQFGNALQAAIQIHISKDSGWSYGGDEDARVHENEFEDPIFGLVRMLIEKGADINAQGGEYGNALQAALCLGKPGIARFLIRKGADVHMLGGKHGNMIQAALSGGCRDLAEVLIRQGVDVNANDGFDEAISTALSKGYDNIVNLLLEDCKGPNLTDEELDSSLQEAVLEGDVDSAKGLTNLIVRFSEPGSRQRKLNDAVAAALAHGHHDIFGFLVGKGAKIDLEAFRRCADV